MPPNRSSFLAAQRYGQAGASLIEFSVVAVPILLLGLGSVDIASWFFTRQAVSLALLEAGRAGIVSHAHPQRSEEPTSELQSLMRISYAVFCLKKTKYIMQGTIYYSVCKPEHKIQFVAHE